MTRPGTDFVRYDFHHAVGGFVEFPTSNAIALLPPQIQPVEPHHGRSVLSVMAFDFRDSPVGAYGELVLSVLVAPRLTPGHALPRAAFYPFCVGTTTVVSRDHAIERWRLPHFMSDIQLSMRADDGDMRVAASQDGNAIIDMRITDYEWEPVRHRYQCVMHDAAGHFMAEIDMAGAYSENEEERGKLTIHPHAFNAALDREAVNTTPFRELWMRAGHQMFHPLQQVAPGAAGVA